MEPKEKAGDLDMKARPLESSTRVVSFIDTKPCTVCKGEDHKAAQCEWGMSRRYNTYWGKNRDNRPFKPTLIKPAQELSKDDLPEDQEDGPSSDDESMVPMDVREDGEKAMEEDVIEDF